MQENKRLQQLFSFLALDEKDAFTLYSIAYEYMQLENWQEAITYFEKLKTIHPLYIGLYYHLGRCYEKINEKERGMTIFQEGLEIAATLQDNHAFAELKNTIQNRELGIEDED